MAQSSGPAFSLKLMVAKHENKVIMAEADKEFMEVFFSFMVMPTASVVRRTRGCLSGDIGCLNNLYSSIENLDEDFLQDKSFRNVLLYPRSAAELYYKNLQLNLIENRSTDFYVCNDKNCKAISYYRIGKCRCGEDLKHKIINEPNSRLFLLDLEAVSFLKSSARFMITDDFKVIPVAAVADLSVLNELGKYEKIEERIIKIGRDEVLNLLKRSFRSKTPMSETFLKRTIDESNDGMKYGPKGLNPSLNVRDFWKKRTNIHLTLIFNKVQNIALYAVVKEDFVNLLCTFLTYPLGYIFNQFPCLSFEGCLNNLHKSIQGTDINLFSSKEKKEILVNPKLAPGLPYNSNLIGIEEATTPSFVSSKKTFTSTNPNKGKRKVFEGFIKEPATFLVMDNLRVEPLSPISVKLLVDKLKVPLTEIDEQEVIIDEDKAMRLLAASLTSDQALTTTFLPIKTNVNCLDFLQLLLWGGKGTDFKGC